jgi:hypothetical protein
MVDVIDAADGSRLGEFYVDVLNYQGGWLAMAIRGSGVREKMATTFANQIADQLNGGKMKAASMRKLALVLSAACLATTSVAAKAERIVNYAIDDAKARQEAEEQGVPFTPLPQGGARHIAIEVTPGVDHEVIRVGITCSAWSVRNPVSTLLKQFLSAWDRDGKPDSDPAHPADLTLRIDRAATVSRCVNTAEMQATCITRVSIDGISTENGGAPLPIHVEREMATRASEYAPGLPEAWGRSAVKPLAT